MFYAVDLIRPYGVRRADPVLCADGLDAIGAGLAAPAAKPEAVSTAPGTLGRIYAVPPAPGDRPRFNDPAVCRPEQDRRRSQLPAELTAFLTAPGDPGAPSPAPPRR